MKIVCVGGGPAGLYLALLMKKANPGHDVTVLERNRPDDTFGFGVVFSDATLDRFADADPETHDAIVRSFAHWDDVDVHYQGQVLTSTGHGFAGMSRQRLLDLLHVYSRIDRGHLAARGARGGERGRHAGLRRGAVRA